MKDFIGSSLLFGAYILGFVAFIAGKNNAIIGIIAGLCLLTGLFLVKDEAS
jgi:hypothetical protein